MYKLSAKILIQTALLCWSIHLYSENASSFTADANYQVRKDLPFSNLQDFEDAKRGFIAPLPDGGVIKNHKGEVIWNLAAFDFMQIDPKQIPPTVNPSLARQVTLLTKAGLFKVTDGIYQVRGADLSNMTIVEGKTGLIIIDPLTSQDSARIAINLYYQNRPKKPIKAVIYTHSHADHFGGVKGIITQQDVNSGQIKVYAPEGFTKAALDENAMAGNAMSRRAMYMYGSLLKPGFTGQMSSGLGLAVSKGVVSLILPTDFIVKTGEQKAIDGVRFVFLMAPGSEAPAEMLFYLPDFKALCAAEDATHTMHNLYTLRGAKIRDSRAWAHYLNQAIEMFGNRTEVVFAQHHWPKWGNANVIDFLEKQRDLYKFIHDQTLHFANQGYTMLEIGEMIKLPDSLAKEWYNRGYYGSLNHNAKSVYNFYLGWFNGNPSTLHALPEVLAAPKYVEYMGGAAAIMERASRDFQEGNYRFAAQVLNHVVFADPNNQQARDLLADILEQLGYQQENATWRNFYLTGAKELRLGVQQQNVPQTDSPDVVAAMPIESFFDYLAIKLNGLKAAQNPMLINIDLTDVKQYFLLQIKNGVLNYFSNRRADQANVGLSLSRRDLNDLILGQTKIDDLIASKKLFIKGNREELKKFLSLLDQFNPWFNIVEPLN